MLLLKVFLAFFALQTIGAIAVTCNPEYKIYRNTSRTLLVQQLDVFVAVSYASVQEKSSKEVSLMKREVGQSVEMEFDPETIIDLTIPIFEERELITFEIDNNLASIRVPITFVVNNKDTFIHILSETSVHKLFGFESLQENFAKGLSVLQLTKVYIFGSTMLFKNRSITAYFEACLMRNSIDENTVENSLLVLVLGELMDEKEIIENIKAKQLDMRDFKFDGIEDQNYAVCEHLEYYFNECKDKRVKLWIFLVEFLIVVIIGALVAKCYAKHSKRSLNQTQSNEIIDNRRPVRRNQVAPILNQTTVCQVAPISDQITIRQVAPILNQTTVCQVAPITDQITIRQVAPIMNQITVCQVAPISDQITIRQVAPIMNQTTVCQVAPISDHNTVRLVHSA
jgi:hypothetical protein